MVWKRSELGVAQVVSAHAFRDALRSSPEDGAAWSGPTSFPRTKNPPETGQAAGIDLPHAAFGGFRFGEGRGSPMLVWGRSLGPADFAEGMWFGTIGCKEKCVVPEVPVDEGLLVVVLPGDVTLAP